MKSILLFILMIIFLSGCVFVGIGNSPDYSSKMVYRDDILSKGIDMRISLSRPNYTIFLPFIVPVVEKKDYKLDLYVLSKERFKTNIDSIKYTILDSSHNKLPTATFIQFGNNFKFDLDTAYTNYESWAGTAPIIKIPKNMYGKNLIIDYEVYFTGQSTPYKGTKALDVTLYPWLVVNFFR